MNKPSPPPGDRPSAEDQQRILNIMLALDGLSVARAEYLLMVSKHCLLNLQVLDVRAEAFLRFAHESDVFQQAAERPPASSEHKAPFDRPSKVN